jgi:uncharacterized membrane protein
MRLLWGTLLAVLVFSIAAVAYTRVGWTRMEADCGADRNSAKHGPNVSYSSSWKPTGFQCTYGDGAVETSLWF